MIFFAPPLQRALAVAFGVSALLLTSPSVLAADARASRFYEDALNRYEKQDLPGAIIQLKNALQIDKTMLPVQLLLGKALFDNGELNAAEVALNEALRVGVDRAEVVLPLARTYLALGRHQQLLNEPVFAMGGLPTRTQVELWVLRSSASLGLGDVRGSLAALEQARKLDPRLPDSWLAEVPVRIRGRQFTEALAAADRALALAPQSAEALYQRGSVLHVQGDARGAIAAYDQVLAKAPRHVEARVARAGLYIDTARTSQAVADLAELERIAPKEPRSAYLRALLAQRDGKTEQAKKLLAQVTALIDPVPVDALKYRPQLLLLNALAHAGLNESEKAIGYLDVLQRVQGSTPASKLLARLYAQNGDTARAAEVLETYVRAQPGDPQALLQLASAYMALGRNAPAISLMQEALRSQDRPELRAMLGIGLLGSGQVGQGVGELEAALRKEPGQAQAGTMLAGLYLREGQGAKAAKLIQDLLKRQPDNPIFHDMLAQSRAQTGDLVGARTSFERAIALDGSLLAPKLHLARLEIGMRQYDAAGERLKVLLAENEKNVDVLLELSLLADRSGQPQRMLEWLQKADDASTARDVRPLLGIVDLHLREGQPQPALEAARRLQTKAAPDNPLALLAIGRAQTASGDKMAARATLASAARLAEGNAALLAHVAGLQLDVQDTDRAAYALDKALALRPDLLDAQVRMVDVELARKDVAAAERRARQIAEQHPKLAVGHVLLGGVALARGAPTVALDAYRRAYQIEPSPANFERLFSVQAAQDLKAATQLAEQWAKQRPGDAVAQRLLGDTYARGGQYAQARRAYEAQLKAQPQDPVLTNNLANVLLRLKDPGAIAMAERAVSLSPGDANALDTLGWALFQAGGTHRERALALLRDARLRAPGNPVVRYHLAAALAQAGRTAEARSEAQGALDASPVFEQRAEAEQLLNTLK